MTDKWRQKIIKYYNDSQIFYDLFWMNKRNLGMHYGFWEKGTKNLHEAIINENRAVAEKLKIEKSDIILDAGCGVGGTAIWLAENYGVKVVGINIVKKQIEMARKYAKKRRVDHLVSFEVRDFCNTGFPNGFFTKIFGIESICQAVKKEDFLKESFRLLKPGGILVVVDGFLKRKNLDKEDRNLYNGWCEGWAVPGLLTIEEFSKELERAGFKNIGFRDTTEETKPSARKVYIVIGKIAYPVLKILKTIKLVPNSYSDGAKAGINQYFLYKKQIVLHGLFQVQKL